LDRFAKQSPVSVMLRATMENAFRPEAIDALFVETAQRQHESELLFSTVVEVLSLVVCSVRGSVHAAYRAAHERVGVSVKSLYNKLNGVETVVSRELLQRTAAHLREIVRELKLPANSMFPGYCTKIVDGNHLPASEHRLAELRTTRSGPLPGQALCVLEPGCMLITDVFPCEDGHAQERSLLPQVVETVQPRDLWIADRNFCTTGFLFGIAEREGCFLIRQHASTLSWEPVGPRVAAGRCETGRLYEQKLRCAHPDGRTLSIRRVTLVLDRPTEQGDTEIHLLTNLPRRVASASQVAVAYRLRWKVENAFQELEQALESEIRTLAYPQAALLAFCIALVTYNLLSVVKSSLVKQHGDVVPRERLSSYYLAEEISACYGGMLIAVPARTWRDRFSALAPRAMARVLQQLASAVHPDRFRKVPRGPKKPRPKRTSGRIQTHVSTAQLLRQRRTNHPK
jgi:hypothetical protein